MMKKLMSKYFIIFTSLAIAALISCIDDNVNPPLTGDLNPVAEMLVYFESLGDFPNSNLAPALIEADEVFVNLYNYLLIDIRPEPEFLSGHIENAVNVSIDSLFYFVELNSGNGLPKIVIIDKNGQGSSYFTCLLRLTGFDNTYTLHFGMAAWHQDFADEWLNALGNDPEIAYYINEHNPKNDFSNLPDVFFPDPNAPIEERIKERIMNIISEGFNDEAQFRNSLVYFSNDYLVCYGSNGRLYNARNYGPLAGLGHHEKAIFYMANPLFELRSTEFLQTLPANNPVIIYDGTGELSACMAAYLRVLGYNAQTILFGANQLFYDRMVDDPDLMEFVFSESVIKNFPYVSGR